ncbi:MAG: hypothetical protein [Circular genetic element sp.]|nr:MAG: hypothetical protein [Circular genetic element sp.]
MSEIIKDTSKFLLTQSLAWATRNPLEALGATAIMSNSTTRKLTLKIAGHLLANQARDIRFFSKLIYADILAPAGSRYLPTARAAATSPAVVIPAAILTTVAVGAAISANTVVSINRSHNIPSSSPQAHWSPFGGMGFGTVV